MNAELKTEFTVIGKLKHTVLNLIEMDLQDHEINRYQKEELENKLNYLFDVSDDFDGNVELFLELASIIYNSIKK